MIKRFKDYKPGLIAYLNSFLLGVGSIKLILITALVTIPICYLSQAKKHSFEHLNFVLLVFVFLAVYFYNYIPYKPDLFFIESNYFFKLCICLVVACVLPVLINASIVDIEKVVWAFSLGALCFSALTIFSSIIFLGFPLHSNLIDLRQLLRGHIVASNPAGISNILLFVPIAFYAQLLYEKKIGIVPVVIFLISFALASLLNQRTYFLLALIILPATLGIFMLFTKKYRCAVFLLIPVTVSLSLYSSSEFMSSFFGRNMNYNLWSDSRVLMFKHFFYEFKLDLNYRSSIGPSPLGSIVQYFHNFYLDIHRISGLYALIFSLIITFYILLGVIKLFLNQRRVGFFFLMLIFPTFIIMLTSVVPEGEKQPFVFLILISSLLFASKSFVGDCPKKSNSISQM